MKKLLLVAGMIGAIAAANAFEVTFSAISNNSGQADAVAPQLVVDVSQDFGTATQAYFLFSNEGPIASSICDIYFDADSILGPIDSLIDATMEGFTGGQVDFEVGAAPPDLSGGNTISPNFVATGSADSESPVEENGINPGEWLGIIINLADGVDFAEVQGAVADGSLRIGLHVQAIGTSANSDAFVNGPPPEPPQVPDASATAMLLGLALLGLEGLRRRMAK